MLAWPEIQFSFEHAFSYHPVSLPSMNQNSSAALRLLDQARCGDAESLALLLKNYFRYLNSLSRKEIDPRIRARVSESDIVQETLLEAHRDFPSFVGTSIEEFTGWLRRILFNNLASAIENHVIAAKRDVRKQRSIDQEKQDDRFPTNNFQLAMQGDFSSPSSPLHRDESLAALMAAISRLPENYRKVIELRHFEGLSFAEIGLRLEKKSGATRMLWSRAVEKLKIEMTPDDSSD